MTYARAGVDVEAADRLVQAIAPTVTSTWQRGQVVGGFGGFAAGVRLPPGYERPVLMLSTDGVGTKAELARLAGRYDGIGQDLVAMLVDDLVAGGARPLAVVDQLTVGRLDPARDEAIVASVAAACRLAGCPLIGGETAEHPGTMDPDRFDLSGTALGVVEDGREVTGAAIRPGDVLVALRSPNLRANGFSLIRHAVLPKVGLVDELLEPSVIYATAVLAALAAAPVHGMAHVTGGGLAANLHRVLPEGCRAVVERASWEPLPVFDMVAEAGRIDDDEMRATFNMGVGFVLVVPPSSVDPVTEAAADHHPWVLGEVVAGDRGVEVR